MKLSSPYVASGSWKLLGLSVIAGILSYIGARVLVLLIALTANIFFRFKIEYTEGFPLLGISPWACFFVPLIGAAVLGLKARYVERGIRGHGIPEIIERIGAIAHAPLTAIFLAVEMTHSYDHLPTVMLVTIVAYMSVKLVAPHSIMTVGLHHKGVAVPNLHR